MGVPKHFSTGGGNIFFYLNTQVDLLLEVYFSLGILPIGVEKHYSRGEGGKVPVISSRKFKTCFFVFTPGWLHVINMLI